MSGNRGCKSIGLKTSTDGVDGGDHVNYKSLICSARMSEAVTLSECSSSSVYRGVVTATTTLPPYHLSASVYCCVECAHAHVESDYIILRRSHPFTHMRGTRALQTSFVSARPTTTTSDNDDIVSYAFVCSRLYSAYYYAHALQHFLHSQSVDVVARLTTLQTHTHTYPHTPVAQECWLCRSLLLAFA